MYVWMYVYMYVYMFICVYICICMYVPLYMSVNSCSKFHLGNFSYAQLIKKFRSVYGNRQFVTVFTTAVYLSLT